jgi:transposase
MFSLSSGHRYHLYTSPCDMRKSFDALSGLVRNQLNRDPACADVFVFLNNLRNSIKLLHWESGGFVVYYKRLEKGTFTPPKSEGKNGPITWPELVLMIEGIQIKKSIQKPRFRL